MKLADQITAFRLPAALTVLAVLVLWESVQPFFPLFGHGPQSVRDRVVHGMKNIAIGLVNVILVRFGFLGVWIAAMDWSREHGVGVLHWAPLPGATGWIVAILLLDGWTYAWHRLNHIVPGLWRFHRLHHSDRHMDATTASRFHLGEIALSSIARVPLLALIGCSVEQFAVYEVALLAVVQFQHANVGLPDRLDRLLRVVIVTPHLHKVHHSVVVAEQNTNFSSLFSWWDRLARTLRLSPDQTAIVFGVDDAPSVR
ncbi:sterol desaturase family protein [Gemmatimonas sp.]|uniref:sterol desaturase family protein n=1 Tax=Gemmatimonas sp. TaxID=1962908 RepID=UPI00286D7A21|nr:sterol desaturase family protein [Gemmatimonas sp.]